MAKPIAEFLKKLLIHTGVGAGTSGAYALGNKALGRDASAAELLGVGLGAGVGSSVSRPAITRLRQQLGGLSQVIKNYRAHPGRVLPLWRQPTAIKAFGETGKALGKVVALPAAGAAAGATLGAGTDYTIDSNDALRTTRDGARDKLLHRLGGFRESLRRRWAATGESIGADDIIDSIDALRTNRDGARDKLLHRLGGFRESLRRRLAATGESIRGGLAAAGGAIADGAASTAKAVKDRFAEASEAVGNAVSNAAKPPASAAKPEQKPDSDNTAALAIGLGVPTLALTYFLIDRYTRKNRRKEVKQ